MRGRGLKGLLRGTSPSPLGAGLVLLLCLPVPGQAQKTDLILLDNGNSVVGEISQVYRGKLTYKTDHMGTLDVKWEHVIRVETDKRFQIQTRDGLLLLGTMMPGPEEGFTQVGAVVIPIRDIVQADRIRGSFVGRTSGHLDVGFTAAQANNNRTLTAGAQVRYRGTRWDLVVSGDSYYQEQSGQDPTARNNATITGRRFFSGVWAATLSGTGTTNDELGLDYRVNATIGVDYRLWRSQRADVSLGAGFAQGEERYDEESAQSSSEIRVSGDLAAFRFDTPKLDLGIRLDTYSSLTTAGRLRTELDSRIRYEVFKDFFLGLNYRQSYDTKPPSSELSKNDYTLSLTIGWSWS